VRNVLIIAIISVLVISLYGCVIVPYEEKEKQPRVSEKKQTSVPGRTHWEK
jgi:hypothetical protein